MKKVFVLVLLLWSIVGAKLTFEKPRIIRQETLDQTLLTVIVPLTERRPDIASIAICFSTDSPMDFDHLGCHSKHYIPLRVRREYGLIDSAHAIRFDVPYWEGRSMEENGAFYNPIVYLEVRNAKEKLLAIDRVRVDPPHKSTLLTQDDQIEAVRKYGPKSPRSVMWTGIALFLIGAVVVTGALLLWRRPRTISMTSLDGAQQLANEGGWYHKV